jgi:hypothetical protein
VLIAPLFGIGVGKFEMAVLVAAVVILLLHYYVWRRRQSNVHS